MKMARLFRSKSCTLLSNSAAPESATPRRHPFRYRCDEEEDEEEDEEAAAEGYLGTQNCSPVTTPFIVPEDRTQRDQSFLNSRRHNNTKNRDTNNSSHHQFPILAVLVAALRKSLVSCTVDRGDVANMEIGWPTDVHHVSHVTFDPFNGFLGLPLELQTHVPRKVPSASVSVFGVSAQSMQCSYDRRGNSVPTILLMLQNHLYTDGGLVAEGIFRINAENGQEKRVRNQLNKGVIPCGIEVHCLAGLIKAWFRELPSGVLDSLTPEQVMHCNTEEECTQLVNSLPTTEAALLDWAINLMADVVQHELYNKMNARNIAMVFAPNMTQMADPLTALIHAVQVMNFLKTLIVKTLREREEANTMVRLISSAVHCANNEDFDLTKSGISVSCRQSLDSHCSGASELFRSATLDRLESVSEDEFWSFKSKNGHREYGPSMISPVVHKRRTLESRFKDEFGSDEVEEGVFDKLGLRRGVRKLWRHHVFQLSKPMKKNETIRDVNIREVVKLGDEMDYNHSRSVVLFPSRDC